jgi:hypothetical protein
MISNKGYQTGRGGCLVSVTKSWVDVTVVTLKTNIKIRINPSPLGEKKYF